MAKPNGKVVPPKGRPPAAGTGPPKRPSPPNRPQPVHVPHYEGGLENDLLDYGQRILRSMLI